MRAGGLALLGVCPLIEESCLFGHTYSTANPPTRDMANRRFILSHPTELCNLVSYFQFSLINLSKWIFLLHHYIISFQLQIWVSTRRRDSGTCTTWLFHLLDLPHQTCRLLNPVSTSVNPESHFFSNIQTSIAASLPGISQVCNVYHQYRCRIIDIILVNCRRYYSPNSLHALNLRPLIQ